MAQSMPSSERKAIGFDWRQLRATPLTIVYIYRETDCRLYDDICDRRVECEVLRWVRSKGISMGEEEWKMDRLSCRWNLLSEWGNLANRYPHPFTPPDSVNIWRIIFTHDKKTATMSMTMTTTTSRANYNNNGRRDAAKSHDHRVFFYRFLIEEYFVVCAWAEITWPHSGERERVGRGLSNPSFPLI